MLAAVPVEVHEYFVLQAEFLAVLIFKLRF